MSSIPLYSSLRNARTNRENSDSIRKLANERQSVAFKEKGYEIDENGNAQIIAGSAADIQRQQDKIDTQDLYNKQSNIYKAKQYESKQEEDEKKYNEIVKSIEIERENIKRERERNDILQKQQVQMQGQYAATNIYTDVTQPATAFNNMIDDNPMIKKAMEEDGISGIRQVNFEADIDRKNLIELGIHPSAYDTAEKKKALSRAYISVDVNGKSELVGVMDAFAMMGVSNIPTKYQDEYIESLSAPYRIGKKEDSTKASAGNNNQIVEEQDGINNQEEEAMLEGAINYVEPPMQEVIEQTEETVDKSVYAQNKKTYDKSMEGQTYSQKLTNLYSTNQSNIVTGAKIQGLRQNELVAENSEAVTAGVNVDTALKPQEAIMKANQQRIDTGIKNRELSQNDRKMDIERQKNFMTAQRNANKVADKALEVGSRTALTEFGKSFREMATYAGLSLSDMFDAMSPDLKRKSIEIKETLIANHIPAKGLKSYREFVGIATELTNIGANALDMVVTDTVGIYNYATNVTNAIVGSEYFKKDSNKADRAQLQDVVNILAKLRSGQAVTAEEAKRLNVAMGSATVWFDTRENLTGGFINLLKYVRREINAPFGSQNTKKGYVDSDAATGANGMENENIDDMIDDLRYMTTLRDNDGDIDYKEMAAILTARGKERVRRRARNKSIRQNARKIDKKSRHSDAKV